VYELRDRDGRILATAGPGTLGLREFLRDLLGRGIPLSGADFTTLRAQALAAGDASALTPDGRLDLRDLTLDDAVLDDALLGRIDASGATLRRAVLVDAHLAEARMVRADLSGAILDRAEMDRADLRFAVLSTAPQPKGHRARHPLRPKADEFRPWDRVLGRSLDLTGADLTGAQLYRADLEAADLAGACLAYAEIERCELHAVEFTGASLRGATILTCALVSPSVHLADTTGAVMRNNTYHAWPGVGALAEAGLHAPRQIQAHLREEFTQRRLMPREMRGDFDRGLAVRAFVTASVPAIAAGVWQALDGVMGISSLLAAGLVSAVMLRRQFAVVFRSATHVALARVIQAEAGLRHGGARRALAVLLSRGRVGEVLGPISAPPVGLPIPAVTEGVVATDDPEALDRLIGRLPPFRGDAPPAAQGLVFEREAGGDLPEETAPRRVALDADGQATATWHDATGAELRTVRFDPLGFPLVSWLPGDPRPRPIAEETLPELRRRRAALEALTPAALRGAPRGLLVEALPGEAGATRIVLRPALPAAEAG
jgi:uncharacterized protein YjbI with pentapeptide repeats